MFRFLLSIALFVIVSGKSATAFMPDYPDDKEFKQCIKLVDDWSDCIQQQSARALTRVKKQYRYILGNRAILEWQQNPQDVPTIFRDMYDSWTAFRNRLCSLTSVATANLSPILPEKYSCELYYNLHHNEHIGSVARLLSGNAPKNRDEFNFLRIYDHDDEYRECMLKKQNDECINSELVRSTKEIKNLYNTLSHDEFVGKWNNGDDLKSGNYRDMYDSWIAYRNRMCSLAVWAYKRTYGDKAPDLNECLQFYNREMLETLNNLLASAHSSLDDEEEGGVSGNTDGGEAEGKTIPPLQRKIDSGRDVKSDELLLSIPDATENTVDNPVEVEPERPHNVPAWAAN